MNRGPSPSLNNIREDEPQSTTPTNTNQTISFPKPNDDVTCTLERIEKALNRTNERLDTHEKQFNSLQNHFNPLSSYLQYILIILVAIILKYIFH